MGDGERSGKTGGGVRGTSHRKGHSEFRNERGEEPVRCAR
jgi:hypothetical protein